MKPRTLRRWLGLFSVGPFVLAGCQSYGGVGYPMIAPSVAVVGDEQPHNGPTYVYAETPMSGQQLAGETPVKVVSVVTGPAYKPVVSEQRKQPQPDALEAPAVAKSTVKPVVPTGVAIADEQKPVKVATHQPAKPKAVLKTVVLAPAPIAAEPKEEVKLDVVPATGIPPLDDESVHRVAASVPVDHEERVIATTTKVSSPRPADAHFWHSDDYTELCGQLLNTRITKGWRLRYAPIDETDDYGGSVRFTEDSQMDGYADGQMVRIRGRLVQDGTKIAPYFRVDAIERQ